MFGSIVQKEFAEAIKQDIVNIVGALKDALKVLLLGPHADQLVDLLAHRHREPEDQMKNLPENPSAGLVLLSHIWKNQQGKSWDAINHSMLYALRLGIGSHLEFRPEDIAFAEENFRCGYWLGEDRWEYPYALAVSVENRSFIEAIESHLKREAFFGNRVTPMGSEGFTHVRPGERARCRLSLRCGVIAYGRPGEVSSINNERVVVVLREYGKNERRILKLSHDDCRELWPAPNKPKKTAEEK